MSSVDMEASWSSSASSTAIAAAGADDDIASGVGFRRGGEEKKRVLAGGWNDPVRSVGFFLFFSVFQGLAILVRGI